MNVILTVSKKKCQACGSANFIEFYTASRELELPGSQKFIFDQQLESCYKCGLVRQRENSSYSDSQLGKYYTSTPRTPLNPGTLDKKDKRIKNALQRLNFIKRQKPKGTLLEAGFGDGVFLNEARKIYNCTGIDPSEGYSYVKEYLIGKGVNIHGGALNSFSSKAAFDVVCSFLVLEHIKDPLTFIGQLKKHLKPNGVLIIEVPDISRYKLFNTESMLTHEHVYHYTIGTLSLLLAKAGLQLIDYNNKNFTYGFSLIAAFKPKKEPTVKMNISGFEPLAMFGEFIHMREQYRFTMAKKLEELIAFEKASGRKIAVYGTGFLFNFAVERCGLIIDNIDYLYDDTPEKSGSKIGPRMVSGTGYDS